MAGGGLGGFFQRIKWAGADVAIDDTERADGCGCGDGERGARGFSRCRGHGLAPNKRKSRLIVSSGGAIICQSATRRRKLLSRFNRSDGRPAVPRTKKS